LNTPSKRPKKTASRACVRQPRIFTLDPRFTPDNGPLHLGRLPQDWERLLADNKTAGGGNLAGWLKDFFNDRELFPLVWRAARDREVILRLLCEKVIKYLQHIAWLAEAKDNPIAAQELARIAFAASRSLHGIVTKHPELLEAVANEEFNWPMLVSPYPNFCQPEPDWKRLGLGQGFPFKLSAKSRFNVSDKLGRLAWRLWHYVWYLRNHSQSARENLKELTTANYPHARPSFATYLKASELGEFAGESVVVRAWFEVAQTCLIEVCHKPESPTILDETHPVFAGVVKAKSKTRSPGRLRSKIIEEIEEKFYWFAGLNPSNPAPRRHASPN